MSEYSLIRGCAIHTPERYIGEGDILVHREKIENIGKSGELKAPRGARIYNFKGDIAAPGFVDIHVHGGGGADFIDSSIEGNARALQTHLRAGTTTLLPTLITSSKERTLKAIRALGEVKKRVADIPDVIGLNLEGPYISREKAGIHRKKFIRPFSQEEILEFIRASAGSVKIMTIAPELEGALDFLRFLKKYDIVASAGHTDATYSQMEQGIKAGIRLATHLFNAMRGIHHRDPGAAGALLFDERVYAELIADGFHIYPAILRMVFQIKPVGKIILVTDATRWAGLKEGAVYNRERRLAGSTLTLNKALQNIIRWTGRPLG
jgi:N-acetylglucosamine-6-phosphate deacetylase